MRVSAMRALADLAQQDRTFRKQALQHKRAGGSCFRNCCGVGASSFGNWEQKAKGYGN